VEDEHKIDLQKRSLINQEQHVALEVLTSQTAHSGRERENTPTKQQGATKAQQDLSVNMVINT
jgi:hypothetical protein